MGQQWGGEGSAQFVDPRTAAALLDGFLASGNVHNEVWQLGEH